MKIDRITCSRHCTLSIELLTNWAPRLKSALFSRNERVRGANEACQLHGNYGKHWPIKQSLDAVRAVRVNSRV